MSHIGGHEKRCWWTAPYSDFMSFIFCLIYIIPLFQFSHFCNSYLLNGCSFLPALSSFILYYFCICIDLVPMAFYWINMTLCSCFHISVILVCNNGIMVVNYIFCITTSPILPYFLPALSFFILHSVVKFSVHRFLLNWYDSLLLFSHFYSGA